MTMPKPEREARIERLMMVLAKAHDRNVSEREQGAALALRCGSGMAGTYWSKLAMAALRYLDREEARDLLHDGATDDPNNSDCPSERVAPATSELLEALKTADFMLKAVCVQLRSWGHEPTVNDRYANEKAAEAIEKATRP